MFGYKLLLAEKDKRILDLQEQVKYLRTAVDSYLNPVKQYSLEQAAPEDILHATQESIDQAILDEEQAAKMLTGELIEV